MTYVLLLYSLAMMAVATWCEVRRISAEDARREADRRMWKILSGRQCFIEHKVDGQVVLAGDGAWQWGPNVIDLRVESVTL